MIEWANVIVILCRMARDTFAILVTDDYVDDIYNKLLKAVIRVPLIMLRPYNKNVLICRFVSVPNCSLNVCYFQYEA